MTMLPLFIAGFLCAEPATDVAPATTVADSPAPLAAPTTHVETVAMPPASTAVAPGGLKTELDTLSLPSLTVALSPADAQRFAAAKQQNPSLALGAWVEQQNQESSALTAVEVLVAAVGVVAIAQGYIEPKCSAGEFLCIDPVMSGWALGGAVLGVVLPTIGFLDALDIGSVQLKVVVPSGP